MAGLRLLAHGRCCHRPYNLGQKSRLPAI